MPSKYLTESSMVVTCQQNLAKVKGVAITTGILVALRFRNIGSDPFYEHSDLNARLNCYVV